MPPKGSKRKAAAQSGAASTKQPKQDGQKAVSKDINVPLDEGFNGGGESAAFLGNYRGYVLTGSRRQGSCWR